METVEMTTDKVFSLLMNKKGYLPSFDLLDCVARGTLLIDLVQCGLVSQENDAIEVAQSKTGVAPLDLVLNEMLSRPGLTLEHEIEGGSTSVKDVIRHLTATGRWTTSGLGLQGRRYKVIDPRLAQLREMSYDRVKHEETVVWCVLSCAGGVTRPPTRPSRQTINQCGDLSWVVEVVVDEILRIQKQNEQAGWALRLS